MEGSAEVQAPFSPAAVAAGAGLSDPPAASRAGEGACANCGAALGGNYCASCGQKAHLHRSIGEAVHEMVHSILHFDGKLWKTLPLLAVRPGVLTRDYIEGRRARYISPFALFLFTIFLTFLVFSFGSPAIEGDAVRVDGATIQVGAAAPEVGKAPAGPASADLSGAVGPDNLADFIRDAHASGVARISFFGIERIEKRANAALANPDLVFYKMKQKGYKLSFLLVPLSLPWLWLLFFWRREYRGYDHVVFLLYSISFMSLLVMAAVLLSMAGVTSGWIYAALLLGYPLVHMFLQLKGAYALTTGGALWRTAVLATAAAVTLVFYLLIVLLLGLID